MSGAKFLDLNAPLPDELVPFKGKLGFFNESDGKLCRLLLKSAYQCYRDTGRSLKSCVKNNKTIVDPQPPCFGAAAKSEGPRTLELFLFGGGI